MKVLNSLMIYTEHKLIPEFSSISFKGDITVINFVSDYLWIFEISEMDQLTRSEVFDKLLCKQVIIVYLD